MCEEAMKVSIITVCYNSAKTIEHTIKSVAGQDYGNIEYIIIDGGSTDGTLNILDRYKDKIDVLVSEPDEGIYDAMNKGIARATGDVIGFINSDDWYADRAIVAIVEAFKKTDADIVYGKYVVVENGVYREVENGNLSDICLHMVFGHPATFVRADCMKKHVFDVSYRIAADYAFFLAMYFQNKSFHQIDTIIAYFRVGGASAHSFKTYIESKRASLRLSKGKVPDVRYLEIRDYYRKNRTLPIFSFLIAKLRMVRKQKFSKCMKKRKLILYGAGNFGKKVFNAARELGLNVIAFWDSNFSLYGNNKENVTVPIQAPYPKKQRYDDAIILLTTIKDNDAIAAKLQSLGYENEKDFFRVETWLGWVARVWMGRTFYQ